MSDGGWRSPEKAGRPSAIVLVAAVFAIVLLLAVAITSVWVAR